jgi:hypothetical protein
MTGPNIRITSKDFWISMSNDQLWANIDRVWAKPENYALSYLKQGIGQLESRGFLTKAEAALNLSATLKARAMRKKETT